MMELKSLSFRLLLDMLLTMYNGLYMIILSLLLSNDICKVC